ncbi:hypothetical protein [Streptomyces sp900116325]|uniref:hypothetical protein n=1 Tax=Streptomyces sp. 900116325 TaxID=3154295 RepID=UPI0033AA3446
MSASHLLKAILQTAVDDELLQRNPCRIKGASKEEPDEWPVATVEQVFALAEAMGPRWRLMTFLGPFASLRPEELAELRRNDIDLEQGALRIVRASPERTNGQRVTGDPKSRAGKRLVSSPRPSCPSCDDTQTTRKARVYDLGLRRGAGDENRTRALSLGITGPCDSIGELTSGNGCQREPWSAPRHP